ncbi:hypothetical protein DFH09DRAFT_1098201 [Mycena vulgaris]|nr:hypothetical protein DFH09DRAFT_1098201 [Mycena vulgaris]
MEVICSARTGAASSAPVSVGYDFSFPLGFDLWVQVIEDLLLAPTTSSLELAMYRAIVACVSKGWHFYVYSTPSFWSSISISKTLDLEHLDFVLDHCGTSDLSICLALRDIQLFATEGTDPTSSVLSKIPDIFARISSTSPRWKTFELFTENPAAFMLVNDFCENLPAPSLQTLRISYLYMPGFSYYAESDTIYDKPAIPTLWFNGHFPRLVHLTSSSAPLSFPSPNFYSYLETVDLSDRSRSSPLDASVLATLFRYALKMRSLRLGAIPSFDFPPDFKLISLSLRAIDIEFYMGDLVGSLLAVMDVPHLIDLTLRRISSNGHSLLGCMSLLARITRLALHFDVQDTVFLHQLFTCLPMLTTLDLLHSTSAVFMTYCDWAFSRLRFQEPNHAANLVALYLCRVDLDVLALLVTHVKESVVSSAGQAGIHVLRVERPLSLSSFVDSRWTLSEAVPDFAFMDIGSVSGSTRSLLNGSSFHTSFNSTSA